jgi:hypothetical protein
VGNRGYVSSFGPGAPLVVLDLADPLDPRIAGELLAPGFSDQLIALSANLLLGVGREVSTDGRLGGVKLALFDVANASAPRELTNVVWGGAGSASALDYSFQGLNLQVTGGVARVALPLMLTSSGSGSGTGSVANAPARSGLQRIEVDLATGRWVLPALLNPSSAAPEWDVAYQRSLQMGAQIYHLRGGQVSASAWAP